MYLSGLEKSGFENCAFAFRRMAINSAFGLDKLLVLFMQGVYRENYGYGELSMYSFDKKSGEIVEHGSVMKTQNPLEYYFSATNPYRFYVLDASGVLVSI